jgi:hypothetical protein
MRIYHYVGPPDLAPGSHTPFHGQSIATAPDFTAWREARTAAELREPLTYVIDAAVTLRLAPRQIEHVVCAGGSPVLGAGEISFSPAGGVHEITNQSTGYCPDTASWEAVALALDKAAIPHPRGFTHAFVFRRCTSCGHRTIVKDSHFFCAICDASLPPHWNFGSATGITDEGSPRPAPEGDPTGGGGGGCD